MIERRLSSLILLALWPATIATLLALIMGWRHLAGEDSQCAGIWAFMIGGTLTAILVPTMGVVFLIVRWRGLRRKHALWATLAPAMLILIGLIFETGFRSPSRWALNGWTRMYLHIEAPSSAKNVRSKFGQAIGGCDGWFAFECTREDATKLIADMRVSRTDESRRHHFSPEPAWWLPDAELKQGEYYERTDGPWTCQLWTNASQTRVLLVLWCG